MKKTISQLFGVLLGVIVLILAFALMLRFHTAPATAFAYLLFFTTLRSITIVSLSRERLIQFAVASILCMAASFWVLTSDTPMVWDRQDATPYAIVWRSALILFCIVAVPHLATRSIKPLRSPIS
jgi:hypothetical protein